MSKFVYIAATVLIVGIVGIFTFTASSFLTSTILALIVPKEQAVGLSILLWTILAGGIGTVLAFLSFIPSYKLALKLAKTLQSRGWEIKNEKTLFWVSLGLLFLSIILLVLLSLLQ